ncbi:hypothetical protein GCM10023306_10180 [Novosphingobium ginsenosidimutans]
MVHCGPAYRWANRVRKYGTGFSAERQRVAVSMRKGWLVLALAAAALLGWAWHDGGEVPQRLIAQPVTLPGVNA